MRKRAHFGIVFFTLCLLASGAVWAEGESCEEIQKWITVNRDSLPQDYDGLMDLPKSHRRAVLGAMSGEAKSLAWRQHIERYMDTRSRELSVEQMDLLEEVLGLLTPRVFKITREDPAYKPLVEEPFAALTARAHALFSEEEIGDIFYRLGSADDDRGHEGSVAEKRLISPCNCVSSYDCDYFGYCNKFSFCRPVQGGCGYFGWDDCTGLCR